MIKHTLNAIMDALAEAESCGKHLVVKLKCNQYRFNAVQLHPEYGLQVWCMVMCGWFSVAEDVTLAFEN